MRTQNDTHSLTVGYLLWLFGFLGAHRFYYGKRWTGVLWFFTLGLLGVGWLLDLIFMPAMEREADARYASGLHNYTVAWVLLTFLGPLGMHRFYLGRWKTGLLWLFTGGLFGVGWLLDFLTLNEMTHEANLGA
jgi:TM2 domain-containing membrane protein YozV